MITITYYLHNCNCEFVFEVSKNTFPSQVALVNFRNSGKLPAESKISKGDLEGMADEINHRFWREVEKGELEEAAKYLGMSPLELRRRASCTAEDVWQAIAIYSS